MTAYLATGYLAPMAGGFLALDNAETWVLVAFIGFAALLYYVGAPGMLTNVLDARAAEIRRQLEEARRLREEAQRKLAEFERRQQDVRRQADEIVDKARRDAERAAEEAKKAIDASAALRVRAAEEQIALAEADAIRAVRDEAVDAAIAATRTILKETLTSEHAARLLDEAVMEVGAKAH